MQKNSKAELKLNLRIPAVAQSFDSCAIIKLEYFLKVCWSWNLLKRVPVLKKDKEGLRDSDQNVSKKLLNCLY